MSTQTRIDGRPTSPIVALGDSLHHRTTVRPGASLGAWSCRRSDVLSAASTSTGVSAEALLHPLASSPGGDWSCRRVTPVSDQPRAFRLARHLQTCCGVSRRTSTSLGRRPAFLVRRGGTDGPRRRGPWPPLRAQGPLCYLTRASSVLLSSSGIALKPLRREPPDPQIVEGDDRFGSSPDPCLGHRQPSQSAR